MDTHAIERTGPLAELPEEADAPYGVAKEALLVMLQAYRQQYGLKGIYLPPVNLYGPGDNIDLQTSHIIPALIRKLCVAVDENHPEVVLWGTGAAGSFSTPKMRPGL
jgi:GDP-L-fucose synthase